MTLFCYLVKHWFIRQIKSDVDRWQNVNVDTSRTFSAPTRTRASRHSRQQLNIGPNVRMSCHLLSVLFFFFIKWCHISPHHFRHLSEIRAHTMTKKTHFQAQHQHLISSSLNTCGHLCQISGNSLGAFLKIVFRKIKKKRTGRQCTNSASGDSCHQRRAIRRNNIPSWIQVKYFSRTSWLFGDSVQSHAIQAEKCWLDVPFAISYVWRLLPYV